MLAVNESFQRAAQSTTPSVSVVGAGVAGLAATMLLAGAGCRVTLLERSSKPGGKIRTIDTAAGPADAGPTVVTMAHVFEELFRRTGSTLSDHVRLTAEPLLARHWWRDGSSLDLFSDRSRSIEAVRKFSGTRAANQFERFAKEAEALFDAFQRPVMEAATPSRASMLGYVARRPWLAPMIAPHQTLADRLSRRFNDPRLQQLFGRYATYVGGSPLHSPAILSLIFQAEASGVWRVEGGVQALADAMAARAEQVGAMIECDTEIVRIDSELGEVEEASGRIRKSDAVLYAGDPAALVGGLLGPTAKSAATKESTFPRSLSAFVWAFASTPAGPDLAHHNVFFGEDRESEFRDLANDRMPEDPTLYICAQDRGAGTPPALERFEIIMNGPPTTRDESQEEIDACRTLTFETLAKFGLTFSKTPGEQSLTTPAGFARLFPGSEGSLYGLSPHGLEATFKRPTARSNLKGLYLAGGGTHPGAGVPMATLSGLRAAETIAADLALTSTSHRTVTLGGT